MFRYAVINFRKKLCDPTARLKCIAEHEWDKRRYLDMLKLEEMDELKGKAEG